MSPGSERPSPALVHASGWDESSGVASLGTQEARAGGDSQQP